MFSQDKNEPDCLNPPATLLLPGVGHHHGGPGLLVQPDPRPHLLSVSPQASAWYISRLAEIAVSDPV